MSTSAGTISSSVYDVIIIGAGIEGSSTAYYLTSRGTQNVLLLEQFDRGHVRGSSHGGSRITRKAYHQSYYVKMMDEAFKMWSEIEIKSGNQLYQQTGITVFGDGEIVGQYIKSLEANSTPHQVLSGEEANLKYPHQLQLPNDYICVFEEYGGILRASKGVATIQDLFIQYGGQLLDNHKVTDIIPGDIVTVQTERGNNFKTKRLILTAGAWTNKLIKLTGLTLPLQPYKAEVLYWNTENPKVFSADEFPVFAYKSKTLEIYGQPIFEYPGLFKVCGDTYQKIDPDARDYNPSSYTWKSVSKFIKGHFKGVVFSEPAIYETCITTYTPDRDPFLDRHPNHPNIVIGAGFSGHGFKLGPVVGKILTELALELPLSYDLSYFRIDRFKNNLSLEMESSVYDVIIIGAGIEGSSTAYYLTSRGTQNVLLLEQFDRGHVRGSSHGGSRITRKAYHQSYYVKMMDEAFKMWSEIEIKSGNNLFVKTGTIIFGGSDVDHFIKSLEANNTPHQVLSGEEANLKYPHQLQLPNDYTCVFEEHGGILRASKAVATIQDLFIQHGGQLLDNHKVTDIIPGDIITVQTERGNNFKTKRLILTAGAWTNKLTTLTGLTLPLQPIRTEVLYWQTEDPKIFSANEFPTFICKSINKTEFYGLPIYEYPGLLKVCLHHGPDVDPDSRDASPDSYSFKITSQFVKDHFKGVVSSEPAIMEFCMYTMTSDKNPFLDRHPNHPNIIIGAGFSGHGFKLGPVVGKILTELALELPPSYDLSYFKIDRFKKDS